MAEDAQRIGLLSHLGMSNQTHGASAPCGDRGAGMGTWAATQEGRIHIGMKLGNFKLGGSCEILI